MKAERKYRGEVEVFKDSSGLWDYSMRFLDTDHAIRSTVIRPWRMWKTEGGARRAAIRVCQDLGIEL
jgi:hypothetical protein